jgi:hypothetical protein
MKKMLFVFVVLYFAMNSLVATSIEFNVQSLKASPATGPWMFHTDDPNYDLKQDGDPYTFGTGAYIGLNNWAYRNFTWDDDDQGEESSSSCISEDLVVLGSTDNITLKIDGFTLASHEHINTADIDLAWDNENRSAGDYRTYVGGTGEIYDNGVLKLKVVNCRLRVKIPYPDAADMQVITGDGDWLNNVGTGATITATGWGTMDQGNSDADWYNEFNQGGLFDGQLRFSFDAFNAVIQGDPGYYDFNITVYPAPHLRRIRMRELNFAKDRATTLDFNSATDEDDCDILFNFTAANEGGNDDTENEVTVTEFYTAPGGILPNPVVSIASQYWQLGTTLESFTTDITFDLEDISNLGDIDNIRVLRRVDSSGEWVVQTTVVVDGTHVKVENVQAFSEWAIGAIQGGTLPVELSSFTADYVGDGVQLSWITQSETNVAGFRILRSESENFAMAQNITTSLIPANNTSTEVVYVFNDNDVEQEKEYFYWIESEDLDGTTEVFGPVRLGQAASSFFSSFEYDESVYDDVYLTWVTQNSGLDEMQYFDIYRSPNFNFDSAIKLNSNPIYIETGEEGEYAYKDITADIGTTYFYWVAVNSWDNILDVTDVLSVQLDHVVFGAVQHTIQNNTVEFSYRSLFENNLSHYLLEEVNGNDVIELGKISAMDIPFEYSYKLAVEQGTTKTYRVKAVTNDSKTYVSPDKTIEIPFHNYLERNYPNPFNPSTEIKFSIENPQNASLAIYNIKGQVVRRYPITKRGVQKVIWNGQDSSNNDVASGLYFYRLKSNGKAIETKKMILMK